MDAADREMRVRSLVEEVWKKRDYEAVLRSTFRGTDSGGYAGRPPTGRVVEEWVGAVTSRDRIGAYRVGRTDILCERRPEAVREGRVLVAGDRLASPERAARHEGGTYNPIDPDQLRDRLVSVGFRGVELETNDFGWAAKASKA